MSLPTRCFSPGGFPVSEIGFGAWAIGANWGETVPEATAISALEAGLDAGMNLIDTADIYGGGRSETLIGKVLPTCSKRVFVATKMGRDADWNDSYAVMEKSVAGSLKRLGVDCLDLVQLHCIPFDTLQAGTVFDNLRKLQSNGLIHSYGASVESIEEGLFCLEEGVTALQVIFNIFRQKLITDLFPACSEAGVGILARVPLASGLLTGKFSPGHQFHPDDHRNFNANGEIFNVGETFAGVPFEKGVALAGKIADILAPRTDGSPAQLALRWILDHPAVTTVIPGAKTPAQARENAKAASLAPLSQEIHTSLSALYRSHIGPVIRGPY